MRHKLPTGAGEPELVVTGSWSGGQEEGRENMSHTQMWAPPLPGWPGATGPVLSASRTPGMSWARRTQARCSPCLPLAIPTFGQPGSQQGRC